MVYACYLYMMFGDLQSLVQLVSNPFNSNTSLGVTKLKHSASGVHYKYVCINTKKALIVLLNHCGAISDT